jgi:hypothetical protein
MAIPSELVDLIAIQAPEASAQGESVILTAPVAFADSPEQRGQIRLTLTYEQAERLAAQIQPAARIARVRSEQRY